MLGTIVNVIAIILGSSVGLIFSKGIKESYQKSLMNGIGLIVLIIGIQGALETENMILIIFSIVLGTLVGEIIDIEKYLNKVGTYLQSKVGSDSNVSTAFVSASLIFCVGAMAIVGALESGIAQNHETLFAKSMLDGISSIIFASTMGVGVIFSSIPVFLYQGAITLLSKSLAHLFTSELINEISAIGGVLIMAIGFNVLEIKKIKIGNMLPSIFIPIIYYFLVSLL